MGFLVVPNDYSYVPAAGVLGLLAAAAVVAWAPAADRRFLLAAVLAAFALRAVAGVVFYYTSLELGGDGTPAGKDDALYFEWGSAVVGAWRDGDLQPPPRVLPGSTQHGYIYVNSLLFALLGQHLLVPVMLNAAVAALTALPVFALTREAWGTRAARFAVVAMVLALHSAFFAALNMKDTLIAFLAVLGLVAVVRSTAGLTAGRVALLLATAIALLSLRPTVALLFAGVAGLFAGLPLVRRSLRVDAAAPALMQQRPLAHAVDGLAGVAIFEHANGRPLDEARDLISRRGEAAEAEGSRVARDSMFDIIADAHGLRRVALLPLAVIYTLVQPFPPWPRFGEEWHFNVLIVANIAWLAIVPFAVYGFLHALRHHRATMGPLLLFTVLWLLAIAWTYYGIQTRYRVTLEPLAAVFAGAGLLAWPASRPLAVLWALALALAAILYLAVKDQAPLPALGALGLVWLATLGATLRARLLAPLLHLRWLDPIAPGAAP